MPAVIAIFTVAFSGVTWMILKQLTGGIRVSKQEELMGLDIGEHGMEAYSGFVAEVDSYGTANPLAD